MDPDLVRDILALYDEGLDILSIAGEVYVDEDIVRDVLQSEGKWVAE